MALITARNTFPLYIIHLKEMKTKGHKRRGETFVANHNIDLQLGKMEKKPEKKKHERKGQKERKGRIMRVRVYIRTERSRNVKKYKNKSPA